MLVQKLRLQKGWSQQQLADLSGLSARTIQRIEQGQSASVESLKSLAAVFEIDFSTLQEPNMSTSSSPSHQATTSNASNEEALSFHHVRKLKGFYAHALQYVLVVGALSIFNIWRQPQHLWSLWVALGWGLGLLVHAARLFDWGPWGPAWEKAQVEKRLGRKL